MCAAFLSAWLSGCTHQRAGASPRDLFAKIEIGMSRSAVEALLGSPVTQALSPGRDTWYLPPPRLELREAPFAPGTIGVRFSLDGKVEWKQLNPQFRDDARTREIQSRPTAAALEVKAVLQHFPALTAWVHTNRTELASLARDIQQQTRLRGLFWSRPPEHVTAKFRDGTMLTGPLHSDQSPSGQRSFQVGPNCLMERIDEWPSEQRTVVTQWYTRLSTNGCHGFDDGGTNWGMRLYLDVNIYIGMPADSDPALREHYESWSRTGPDPRQDVCSSLGEGWYLCTERR
jgi:hypothetical protein